MQERYDDAELVLLMAGVEERTGWDFSSMRDSRAPVPWEYVDVVRGYLSPTSRVLDVGTGGAERLIELADEIGTGLGVDPDPAMIAIARRNAGERSGLVFVVADAGLAGIEGTFDVVLNRHAPLDLDAVAAHLVPGGVLVTQQVGERNMAGVRAALGGEPGPPPITGPGVDATGRYEVVRFDEYDVEYVVHDIESLLFWLHGLDPAHADIDGRSATTSAERLNAVLSGAVDHRGFVTNEHRYLLVARRRC